MELARPSQISSPRETSGGPYQRSIMLEFHAPLRRPLGAGSAVSDPLLREACPGTPLRRSNNADIPCFPSTPLLGLTRPSQNPPKRSPGGPSWRSNKAEVPSFSSTPLLGLTRRSQISPRDKPLGPSSTLKIYRDSALLLDVPLEPDSAVSNSSLREAPGGPSSTPKKSWDSAPLFEASFRPGSVVSDTSRREARAVFDDETVLGLHSLL